MASDGSTDDLAAGIGAAIRALRTAKGLSGRKLALAAGVSQPFLSQLESGQTSVAIATLYRIAAALDVSASDILPGTPSAEFEVHRAADRQRLAVSEELPSAMSDVVFRAGRRISEFDDITVAPGEHVDAWFVSTGEHAAYVIEGCIRMEFKGRPDITLATGDSAFYPASVPRRWHLVGDVQARIILVTADA
jgi:transcriptional regulator with XRE-family HTH domain